MKYTLLIPSQENASFVDHLNEAFLISRDDTISPLIQQIRLIQPQLVIINSETLMNSVNSPLGDIQNDKVYHDIPIVAYYEGNEEKEKEALFAFGVKGIIHKEDKPENYITQLYDILSRSNPHVGTERDRFIKAFIRYEEAYTFISETLYLTNYLIRYYRTDPDKASDIRLAVILLTVALRKRKMHKIMQLIQDLEFTPTLITYLKNYHKPSTIEEKLILASMKIVEYENKNTLLEQAYRALDSDIVTIVDQAIQYNKIYISCTHDIFVFIMRLNKLFGKVNGCIEEMDRFTKVINEALSRILAKYGSMNALIDVTNEKYCIYISLENERLKFNKDIESFLDVFSPNVNLEVGENMSELIVCLNVVGCQIKYARTTIQSEEIITKNSEQICETCDLTNDEKRRVDISMVNLMHYEDHQKVSAKAFLQEFEYDAYLIDDLSESENDAKDALYFKEELTQPMLESVIDTFEHYTHLFNETIEFRDLAYSVNSLVTFLKSIVMENLQVEEKKTLKLYLGGIFENLANWKTHIFITQDSPDIHYLDASLLNDCAQVESFFLTTEKEEGELEFF